MLSQLVYISKRQPNCTEAEIEKILTACKNNNKELDVTGVLLYSDAQFVQYLEGDLRKINSLYNKIKEDKRHKNVALISTAPIKERTFPSWQMGAKKLNLNSVEYHTQLSNDELNEFNRILSGSESNRALEVIKKLFK